MVFRFVFVGFGGPGGGFGGFPVGSKSSGKATTAIVCFVFFVFGGPGGGFGGFLLVVAVVALPLLLLPTGKPPKPPPGPPIDYLKGFK